MKFRDLVDQLITARAGELAAAAGDQVRATGRQAAAARRAEFREGAAARRAEHEAELAEHWTITDADDAQRVIRELVGQRFPGMAATRWLAEEAGLASRTARRWMSQDVPPSRVARLKELAEQLVQVLAAEFEVDEENEWVEFEADEDQRTIDVEQAAAEAEAAAMANARSVGAALVAPVVAGYNGANVGGGVRVAYDDDDEGGREIDDVDIDFAPIAAALADNDLDWADELFDQAVLDSYGDLGDTLTVEDYPGGITLH